MSTDARRRAVAAMCRAAERELRPDKDRPEATDATTSTSPRSADPCLPRVIVSLPPRVGQTLQHLLHGLSEKQTARAMSLSVHTVHDHVKRIYREYGVNSRGELLARVLNERNEA